MNTNTKITAPISSNQVTEVGLLKPACATFKGNTLNDWLKWLAENQCEVDWSKFDLTCLQSLLQTPPTCEQGVQEVIDSLIQAICSVSVKASVTLGGDLSGTPGVASVIKIQNKPVSSTAPTSGQILKWNGTAWTPSNDNSGEQTFSLSMSNDWIASQPAQAIKKGNLVVLKGIVSAGNVNSVITTLPIDCRPSYSLRMPVRTLNTFASNLEESIQIATNGQVTMVYKGVSPVISSSQSIFLDGICYYV
jgi:hypothetical protein